MLTLNDTTKQFYVYTYTNPIDMKIFYIGKGSSFRLYRHLNNAINSVYAKNYNRHLFNKIKLISDLGHPPIIEKIFETNDESLAYQKEAELVKQIGLENLCNLDWGGLGAFRFTDEQRKKISDTHRGKKRSNEAIEKWKQWYEEHGNPFKGKKHSEESKKKNSEAKKKYYETHDGYWKGKTIPEEVRIKFSEAKKGKTTHMLGKHHTEETKLKISLKKLGVKQSPESIEKRRAGILKSWQLRKAERGTCIK